MQHTSDNRNEHSKILPENYLFDLCIIGGGAAGILLLLHTIRNATSGFSVLLINKGYPLAKGVAYSTMDPNHLLNVRAGRMSAYADDPLHFVNWLRLQPEYPDTLGNDKDTDAFVPRYLYGRYLSEIFEAAIRNLPDRFQLKIEDAEAIQLHKNTIYHIQTDSGNIYHANNVALCTGNETPAGFPGIQNLPSDKRICINPWKSERLKLNNDFPVLIVGTGLTMVDHVLSLLNSGFGGKIIAISRHGQLPNAHPETKHPMKNKTEFTPYADLSSLFSLIKKRIQDHPDPQGWEDPVLEDIRPYTQELWYNFSPEEKHRFLRHLQHLWSKLRHRIPFSIAKTLDKAIADKRLLLLGGKLSAIGVHPEFLSVTYLNRRTGLKENYNVQQIVNCTDPELNMERSKNPLIRSLYFQGLIRNSASKLGPDALPDGRTIDVNDRISDTLFVLGPLLRGVIWESVAVPEIRVGADKISKMIFSKSAKIAS